MCNIETFFLFYNIEVMDGKSLYLEKQIFIYLLLESNTFLYFSHLRAIYFIFLSLADSISSYFSLLRGNISSYFSHLGAIYFNISLTCGQYIFIFLSFESSKCIIPAVFIHLLKSYSRIVDISYSQVVEETINHILFK